MPRLSHKFAEKVLNLQHRYGGYNCAFRLADGRDPNRVVGLKQGLLRTK